MKKLFVFMLTFGFMFFGMLAIGLLIGLTEQGAPIEQITLSFALSSAIALTCMIAAAKYNSNN